MTNCTNWDLKKGTHFLTVSSQRQMVRVVHIKLTEVAVCPFSQPCTSVQLLIFEVGILVRAHPNVRKCLTYV